MAQSKAELFNENETLLADIAKALSHPARIKILQILTNMNVCMCGDIVELLPLSQKFCYCVNNKMIEKAKDAFNQLLSHVCKC